jgi:hypothetical protein
MIQDILFGVAASILYGLAVYEFLKREKDDDFFNF